MAAMRFGLVTSAVRICPSTIRRRAAAASNMREIPDCRTGLCDTPRQNASESRFLFRNRGRAPLSPLTAVPLIYVRKALPKQIGAVTHAGTATWRSGYAAVCKTVYPGSIPGVASSRKIKGLLQISCSAILRYISGWEPAGNPPLNGVRPTATAPADPSAKLLRGLAWLLRGDSVHSRTPKLDTEPPRRDGPDSGGSPRCARPIQVKFR